MIRRALYPVLLVLASTSSSACTMLLGDFEKGEGGATNSSSSSSSGAGGAQPGGAGGTAGSGGSSSSSSSSSGGGTGGAPMCAPDVMACTTPGDCPDPGNECVVRECNMGCCATRNVADLEPLTAQTPADCKSIVCDGNGGTKTIPDDDDIDQHNNPCSTDSCSGGNTVETPVGGSCGSSMVCGDPLGPKAGECVECNVADDCQSGICDGNLCVAASCGDTVKNGTETDTDCGGECSPCVDGLLCSVGLDCQSKVCNVTGHCAVPTCNDGVQNGSESAADCGGSTCNKCAAGKTCDDGGDCLDGVCTGGVCKNPTCFDGVPNGAETDADCGGACTAKCADGKTCGNGGDCQNAVCANAICQAPTCVDTVKNGGESDKDCGGSTACPRCAVGQVCGAAGDCQSGVCVTASCQAPNCGDLVKNGTETDTDCGGPGGCVRCSTNQTCASGGDCQSGVCSATKCQAPVCTDTVKNGAETDVDCGGASCPKCATNKDCNSGTDCQSGVCSGGKCSTAGCGDLVKNGTETDIDCGGASCPKCATAKDCAAASDCQSGVCTGNKCQAPSCVDTVKNGGESDVDCGGSTGCPRCVPTRACTVASDCNSSVCFNNTCQAPTCTDGVKNATETDADCGGATCGKCPNGLACASGTDCQSAVCGGTPKLCKAPTCTDAAKNGAETDVDCGGAACNKCLDGKHCVANSDCQTGNCTGGTCISCSDGAKNGNETDIDCGGAACATCQLGKLCLVSSDCASASCVSGHCAACVPGATQCSGNTPQVCNASGAWQGSTACGGATPSCCQGSCTATVAEVATGESHACARKSDGTLWCWGHDAHGQVGDQSTQSPKRNPVQVTPLGNTVAQVTGGAFHTCVRKTDGTAWCWGYNFNGQAGDGTSGSAATPKLNPVQVSSLGAAVAQISAGGNHTCARKTDGTLWCWGLAGSGQIGDGSSSGVKASPVQVTSLGTTVAEVSAGGNHTCARKTDGTLWCWGSNASGQLGDNTTTTRTTPVQVTALGNIVTQVSAGANHTCARRGDDTLWCWGHNGYGELGIGNTDQKQTPTQVPATWADVTAGSSSTCGRRSDGASFCWGWNVVGAIGDGSRSLYGITSPKQVLLVGTSLTSIDVGSNFACARKNDSTVWCWGDNFHGELGDGTTQGFRLVPRRLSMGVCSSDTCINALKNGTETDIDCGGSCDSFGLTCVDGRACGNGGDCASTFCNASHVCATTCANGTTDALETDVDCGGGECSRCVTGQGCRSDDDCNTDSCTAGICD